ncbi:unnamed protein product, partial [Ectocarpus sp. 8 AP-2014]
EVREAEVEVNLMQPPPRTKKGKKKSGAGGIEERLDDFKVEGDEKMVDHGPSHEKTAAPKEVEVEKDTLESKIRKARPPPRVRISSSSQPGFVSLR